MKSFLKIVMLFVFLVLISQITKAQDQEVVYGSVRTDGYDHITKAAFWEERPEAKIIYEGGDVQGFKKHKLKSNHFVRFIDREHNNLDRNYIVFPAGEYVYESLGTGKIYSAKCGNQIEFIRPTDMVRIVEVEKTKTVEVYKTDTVIHKHVFDSLFVKHVFDDKFTTSVSPFSKSFEFEPEKEKKKWFQTKAAKIVGGAIVLTAVGYGGYKLHGWIESRKGGPAGAPSYPADDEGGPAGAPSYPADNGNPTGSPSYGVVPTKGFGVSFNF